MQSPLPEADPRQKPRKSKFPAHLHSDKLMALGPLRVDILPESSRELIIAQKPPYELGTKKQFELEPGTSLEEVKKLLKVEFEVPGDALPTIFFCDKILYDMETIEQYHSDRVKDKMRDLAAPGSMDRGGVRTALKRQMHFSRIADKDHPMRRMLLALNQEDCGLKMPPKNFKHYTSDNEPWGRARW